MAIFKCKMCGGSLDINANETVAICEYCGTKQTLPKLDDEKRVQLYDRANHFRRANEFDKAMGIYEMILSEDKEDAEAYWGIVLCRYGIEYVEDPTTYNRIPTVNRAQFVSVFDDSDYMSAIKYADGYQREVYQNEAAAIDKLQKGILEISSKEEPFDVFICYKETDKNGCRTHDSVLAQEIYTELTKEGYNVFFSRITLEDKLGTAYEPYIFAALNSAKVMLVVGTNREHFNAVWVKNEWSRYLSLIKNGKEKRSLIPVYKDISPYDLPEEMAYLQSQDANKIGFMQDLVRGIKKLIGGNQTTIRETVVVKEAPLQVPTEELEAGQALLEQGNFDEAMKHFENQSKIDPYGWKAYWGMFKCAIKAKTDDDIYFPGFLAELRKSEKGESNVGFIEYYKSAKSKAYLLRSNEINFDYIEMEYKQADAAQEKYDTLHQAIKFSYEHKKIDNIPSEEGRKTAVNYANVCEDYKKAFLKDADRKYGIRFFIFAIGMICMGISVIFSYITIKEGTYENYETVFEYFTTASIIIAVLGLLAILFKLIPSPFKIIAFIILIFFMDMPAKAMSNMLNNMDYASLQDNLKLFFVFVGIGMVSLLIGGAYIAKIIYWSRREKQLLTERDDLGLETAAAMVKDMMVLSHLPKNDYYHVALNTDYSFDSSEYVKTI